MRQILIWVGALFFTWIAIVTMVAFNGIFLSANGVFMLVAPQVWYDFVPGVTDTGFFNQHFIRGIGLIRESR